MNFLPRSALLPASWLVARRPRRGELNSVGANVSREAWKVVAARYPDLGSDPARKVERARRRLWFLADRALSTARHSATWESGRPDSAPTVYLTTHFGDLRALRYALRLEGVPVASVISGASFGRTGSTASDARCDRRRSFDFPHCISAASAHRIRTALRQGSLIMTIDGPSFEFVAVPFLGGMIRLDPRPLRLARLAAVPVRAAFLTGPRGVLTVTLGRKIDASADPKAVLREIGDLLGRLASRSPFDFDVRSHGNLRYEASSSAERFA